MGPAEPKEHVVRFAGIVTDLGSWQCRCFLDFKIAAFEKTILCKKVHGTGHLLRCASNELVCESFVFDAEVNGRGAEVSVRDYHPDSGSDVGDNVVEVAILKVVVHVAHECRGVERPGPIRPSAVHPPTVRSVAAERIFKFSSQTIVELASECDAESDSITKTAA